MVVTPGSHSSSRGPPLKLENRRPALGRCGESPLHACLRPGRQGPQLLEVDHSIPDVSCAPI